MEDRIELKELKIEVTQKCLLNCLHCSSEANLSKSRELPLELVLRLISESNQMEVKEITFSGGEPLLWSPLPIAIQRCHEKGIKSTIYTTGNPIIDDVNLLSKLNLNLVNKIIVSLFGACAEIHEGITRIHGSFTKTLDAIKIFNEMNIPVGVHFVAMSPNWTELGQVVKLCNKLNVKEISVLRFVPHGRGAMVDHYSLSKQDLRLLRQEIIRLRPISGLQIRLGSPFNILLLSPDITCNAAQDRLIIGSDGRVFPCDAFKNLEFDGRYGSVIEHNLKEIWNSSQYLNAVRKVIFQGLGPECSKCKSCRLCKGGCLAQKVIRAPIDISKPDPDCILN